MKEYGYIENGILYSRFIEEFTENYKDDNGVIEQRVVTVEEQVEKLSAEYKPVDMIDEKQMISDIKDYVVIPIPFDAGDHIAYNYIQEFDTQHLNNEIRTLKDKLSQSDYKVRKCYEASLLGLEMPYDIAVIHAESQAQRDKINELEIIINNNGGQFNENKV